MADETILTLRMKKEWWNKVLSGEKTHEYRRSSVWKNLVLKKMKNAKNLNQDFIIRFTLGYPSIINTEKIKYGLVKNVTFLSSGKDTDLKIDEPVIDIEFVLID